MRKAVLGAGFMHSKSGVSHVPSTFTFVVPLGQYDSFYCHFSIFVSLKKMLPSYSFCSPIAPFPERRVCSGRDFFVCFSKRTLKGSTVRLPEGQEFIGRFLCLTLPLSTWLLIPACGCFSLPASHCVMASSDISIPTLPSQWQRTPFGYPFLT